MPRDYHTVTDKRGCPKPLWCTCKNKQCRFQFWIDWQDESSYLCPKCLLQHRFVLRKIRHKFLEPTILSLELLQAVRPVGAQTGIFSAPAVIHLFAGWQPATHYR